MIQTYRPEPTELRFKQKLLADDATMSYNRAWGGTIPFPESRWEAWYDRWLIHHDGERYYRYLRETDTGEFVGEIAFHRDSRRDIWLADVIIEAEHRGKGYGTAGLRLLCKAAAERGIQTLCDEIAADNPALFLFLRLGFTEDHRSPETVLLKTELQDRPRRVLVIGCPGSGKSTFARELRDRTGLPLYYLDMIYHRPDRTTLSREEFDGEIRKVLEKDRWIMDGNYQRTLPGRIERCTEVFLFDLPIEQCLEGAASRVGQAREDLPWVEPEFDPEFRQYILDFPGNQLPEIYRLTAETAADKTVTVFRTREEAEEYLRTE